MKRKDIMCDSYTLMRLLQVSDTREQSVYQSHIRAMAPYKSAVLWPEALLVAPTTKGVRYVHAVVNKRTEPETYYFNRLIVGETSVRDPDKFHELAIGKGDWISLLWDRRYTNRGSLTLGSWLSCPRLFLDIADAVRYAALEHELKW